MGNKAIWVLVFLVGFPPQLSAGGMRAGCSLLSALGRYEEAFAQCRKAAQEGSAEAARRLSNMYREGRGTSPNSEMADHWRLQAAQLEQENERRRRSAATPKEHLAICQQPFDIDSFENTTPHCEKAAESGLLPAHKEPALRYALGYGVEKNEHLAAKWYRLAAEQGDAESQYTLAEKYSTVDLHGPQALLERERWYREAADQGHPMAQYALAKSNFAKGRSSEALKWFFALATAGEKFIGSSYTYREVLKDKFDAVIDSQYHIGLIYRDGIGVPQSYALARQWFSKAAQFAHPEAQYQLGTMYSEGLGGEVDRVLGHMWLNIAASGPIGIARLAAIARDKVASKMRGTEVARAQELARIWFERKDFAVEVQN